MKKNILLLVCIASALVAMEESTEMEIDQPCRTLKRTAAMRASEETEYALGLGEKNVEELTVKRVNPQPKAVNYPRISTFMKCMMLAHY